MKLVISLCLLMNLGGKQETLASQSLMPSSAKSLFVYPARKSILHQNNPVFIGIVKDNNNKPVVGEKVSLLLDGNPLAIVTSNKDGVWSYKVKPHERLTSGYHDITALAYRNSMFLKDTSFFVSIAKSGNVDTGNSQIAYPYQDAYINSSMPTIVGFVNDSSYNPVVNETLNGSLDSVAIYSQSSDSNGVWSYTLTSGQALADGSHITAARAQETGVTLDPVSFIIDTVPPAAPSITSPSNGATVMSYGFTVLGLTEPYAQVTLFFDGDTVGQTTNADSSGVWSSFVYLLNGSHSLVAQAQDLAGNVGPLTNPVSFNVSF